MWQLWPHGSQFGHGTESWAVEKKKINLLSNYKYQLLQSQSNQTPCIILIPLPVRSNTDYGGVLVCVHVLPCQTYVPREKVPWALSYPWHVSGGPAAAITPSSCVRTGQAAAAGNAHWPQWEEPRSEKVMSKETRRGEVYQACLQNQTWIMSLIAKLQCNRTLSWKAGIPFLMKPLADYIFALQTTSLHNFKSSSLELF